MHTLMSHRMLTTGDEGAWRDILPERKSVFGSYAYAAISQKQSGNEARLLVLMGDDAQVVYPFFLRSINSLPFVPPSLTGYYDIHTPEYTGAIDTQLIDMEKVHRLREYHSSICRANNIVAEFGHLNPWNVRAAGLSDPECTSVDREIVYVDLSLDESHLWNDSLSKTCRKTVQRAQRDGIRVFQGETLDHIREFYRVYRATMMRTGALPRYFFSLEYFIDFHELMPHNALFLLAEYRDQIVGVSLNLHDEANVYGYLGGTDQSRPVSGVASILEYESIRWGQRQGKLRFIMGGGYRLNDGVFRFKSQFSPLRANLFVLKKTHLPNQFETLCQLWSQHTHLTLDRSGYFPPYRSPYHLQDILADPMR